MPRQSTVCGERAEGITNPAGLIGDAGELGNLTVGGDAAPWYLLNDAEDPFVDALGENGHC
jgi:hypothetical protein